MIMSILRERANDLNTKIPGEQQEQLEKERFSERT